MHALLRIIKLVFSTKGLTRSQALRVILLALLLNVVFGVAFYYVEQEANDNIESIWDAIWWAMVTMTTVGYGDISPVTPIGRFLIGYPCMILGIGIIGYLVGVVAETILENVAKARKGEMKITQRDHVIICNCPSVDKVIRLVNELRSDKLAKDRRYVVVTDQLEEIPEKFKAHDILFVRGDPTREEVLERANIHYSAGVFVLAEDPSDPSSDHKTFAIGAIVELMGDEQGKSIKVVVEAVSKENVKMMRRTRVDGIVTAEGIIDSLMAQEFLNAGINEVVHQLVSPSSSGSEIYTFETNLEGRTIDQIQRAMVDHPSNTQMIGIIRGDDYRVNPDRKIKIEKGDRLIVVANDRSDVEEIEQELLKRV